MWNIQRKNIISPHPSPVLALISLSSHFFLHLLEYYPCSEVEMVTASDLRNLVAVDINLVFDDYVILNK